MPDISQKVLLDKIQLFLSNLSFVNEKDEIKAEALTEEMMKGFCNGFSLMKIRADRIGETDKHFQRLIDLSESDSKKINEMSKLVSKFRKLYQEEISEKENIKKLNDDIEKCKGDKEKIKEVRSAHYIKLEKNVIEKRWVPPLSLNNKLLLAYSRELYVFIQSLIFAHDPGAGYKYSVNDRYVRQFDFPDTLDVLLPDKYIKDEKGNKKPSLSKAFSLHLNFSEHDLCETLKKTLRNNDVVAISGNEHAIHFTVKDGLFRLYDSINEEKYIDCKTIESLAHQIRDNIYLSFHIRDPIFSLKINIFENPENKANPAREKPIEVIKSIYQARGFGLNDKKNKEIINTHDYLHTTDLHMLASSDDVESVKYLMEKGADCSAVDSDGVTPIWTALQYGRADVIEAMAADAKAAPIDKQDSPDDLTMLYYAVEHGLVDTVKTLVKLDADPYLECGGISPFAAAVVNGDVDIVRALSQSKHVTDLDKVIEKEYGYTPLMFAAQFNQFYVVKELLEKGADVSIESDSGKTALSLTTDPDIVALLKSYGAEEQPPGPPMLLAIPDMDDRETIKHSNPANSLSKTNLFSPKSGQPTTHSDNTSTPALNIKKPT